MNLVRAVLLAVAIATASPAAAEIDTSQADSRLIGMPIYTSDGVLVGQVTNVDVAGSSRSLIAAVGGFMAFGPRQVWIPLTWANKQEDYIQLLLTNAQVEALLFPSGGTGSR